MSAARSRRDLLELVERGSHVLRMREVQPEHVNLLAVVDGTQLDAGDHAHAKSFARGLRCGHAVHRVVIGERDCTESRTMRSGDDIGGRDGAIGRGRVHVEIDVALGRRTWSRPRRSRAVAPLRRRGARLRLREQAREIIRVSSASDCSRQRAPIGE